MNKPTFTFIGHGSLKFKTSDGKVIYVDPFYKGDYSEKADLLLITHNHNDHNKIKKVKQGEDCLVITPEKALANNSYNSFEHKNIKISSFEAYNARHKKEECVGYVLEFNNLKIYCAGDTSKTEHMSNKLSKLGLDYALLPIDGLANMGPEEATECAKIINTRHVIPIHNSPITSVLGFYFKKGTHKLLHDGKIILKHGETINL